MWARSAPRQKGFGTRNSRRREPKAIQQPTADHDLYELLPILRIRRVHPCEGTREGGRIVAVLKRGFVYLLAAGTCALADERRMVGEAGGHGIIGAELGVDYHLLSLHELRRRSRDEGLTGTRLDPEIVVRLAHP